MSRSALLFGMVCLAGAIILLAERCHRAGDGTYEVHCPADSRNPMDQVGEGRAYVDANSWGVIETKGQRLYFWPGRCTVRT